MNLEKGMIVTRKSYNHDTTFKILNIKDNICYLKGIDVRLYADSPIEDLIKSNNKKEDNFEEEVLIEEKLDRDSYFYLIPNLLHLDSDLSFITRCLNYYKKNNIRAIGKVIKESEISSKILKYISDYSPDIIVITGHDAYYKKKGSKEHLENYLNSKYFCDAVKKIRKYNKNHDNLIIIAGACQSNYEELIKSGANFASSPKRVNIHALDPAIIATTVALTKKSETINLIELLNKTKYGSEGMGGVICHGLMSVGYPR